MDREETIARVLKQARVRSGRYETRNEGEEEKLIATMYDTGMMNLIPGFQLRMWHNLRVCMEMNYGELVNIVYSRKHKNWRCTIEIPGGRVRSADASPLEALIKGRHLAEAEMSKLVEQLDKTNQTLFSLCFKAIETMRKQVQEARDG